MIRQELTKESSLDIKELCELAGVSRSGYYRWCNAAGTRIRREQEDLAAFEKIKEAYSFRGYDKGYRGVCMRLLRMGIQMNHKKVRRLMKKYGLRCPIRKANPYRRMAKAMQTNAIAKNYVNREFRSHGPRKILLTDITYIRLNGRFCYLSVIKDAYTMQVLAYQLSESLEVDFVLQTVKQLLRNHLCSLDAQTILHSDQGCHYTSVAFRQLLKDADLRQSMSRRGNCWDNAPQESFFGHMKDEIREEVAGCITFEDVVAKVNDWIDYYNNDRYQWDLLKLSPKEYYQYLQTGTYPLPVYDPKNKH